MTVGPGFDETAMATQSAASHFDLEEGDAYDRIVLEGGYFDYPAAARDIGHVVAEGGNILELCVGSGNLAVEMAALGYHVTGLDASSAMLEKCRTRTDDLGITLVEADATSFDLSKTFDAVVIHSGHLIINRAEEGALRLNGPSDTAMYNTVASVGRHLNPSGKLVMNIEHWDDKTVPYPDGSLYTRIIGEETDEYGTRVHIFYDRPRDTVAKELIIRQPKIPFDAFLGELRAHGFGEFTEHNTDTSSMPTLFSATKIAG